MNAGVRSQTSVYLQPRVSTVQELTRARVRQATHCRTMVLIVKVRTA